MAGSFSPFRLPEYEVPRNAMLDFSPFSEAVKTYADARNTQTKLGMEQERLGLAKESNEREKEKHTAAMEADAVQRMAGISQMVLDEKDPVKKLQRHEQFLASRRRADGPTIKEYLAKYLPPEVLADPDSTHKYVVSTSRGWTNPLDDKLKQAQIGLTEANAAKAQREAAQGPERYGKDIKVFQTQDGQVWGVQAGASGELKYHKLDTPGAPASGGQSGASPAGGTSQSTAPQSQPLTQSRGVKQVGDKLIDISTGRVVGDVNDYIAGEAHAKVRGKEAGETQAGMPKAAASLESANAKSALVSDAIKEARGMVSQWSTGYGSLLKDVPMTQALGLKEQLKVIIANMGFEELQDMRNNSPTGGALGQVAVQELEMLQKTKVSLEQAQSVPQMLKALEVLDAFMKGAKERRQNAFNQTYMSPGRFSQPNATPQPAAPNNGGWSITKE